MMIDLNKRKKPQRTARCSFALILAFVWGCGGGKTPPPESTADALRRLQQAGDAVQSLSANIDARLQGAFVLPDFFSGIAGGILSLSFGPMNYTRTEFEGAASGAWIAQGGQLAIRAATEAAVGLPAPKRTDWNQPPPPDEARVRGEVSIVLDPEGTFWIHTKSESLESVQKLDVAAMVEGSAAAGMDIPLRPGGRNSPGLQLARVTQGLNEVFDLAYQGEGRLDGAIVWRLGGYMRDAAIEEFPALDALAQFGLAPARVEMAVGAQDGTPRELIFYNAGQIPFLTVRCSAVRVNADISPEEFQFAPPEDLPVEDLTAGILTELKTLSRSAPVVSRPAPAAGNGLQAGQPAPDFEIPALGGQTIAGAKLRGRPVLLHFWASWSAPSVARISEIGELHREYGDRGFVAVGVNLDNSPQDMRSALGGVAAFAWPQSCSGLAWMDPAVQEFGVQSLPHEVLIGKDGVIRAVNAPAGEMSGLIEAELK